MTGEIHSDTRAAIEDADQYAGCLLGLATGDAMGAPYEGGPLERLFWGIVGRTGSGELRWTDDTQMTLDLAESLLEEGRVNPDAVAARFASSYNWWRGYGPGTSRVLREIRRGKDWRVAARGAMHGGSYGNGAAMRSAVLALFFPIDRREIVEAARKAAEITHAHPLGVEGAVMIAVAAQALLLSPDIENAIDAVRFECGLPDTLGRLGTFEQWLRDGEMPDARCVAKKLGNGTDAQSSCATSLYIALRHIGKPFEEMFNFIIECGGDVDTIASMSGAIWGIVNGANRLPVVPLEGKLRIISTARKIFERGSRRDSGLAS